MIVRVGAFELAVLGGEQVQARVRRELRHHRRVGRGSLVDGEPVAASLLRIGEVHRRRDLVNARVKVMVRVAVTEGGGAGGGSSVRARRPRRRAATGRACASGCRTPCARRAEIGSARPERAARRRRPPRAPPRRRQRISPQRERWPSPRLDHGWVLLAGEASFHHSFERSVVAPSQQGLRPKSNSRPVSPFQVSQV